MLYSCDYQFSQNSVFCGWLAIGQNQVCFRVLGCVSNMSEFFVFFLNLLTRNVPEDLLILRCFFYLGTATKVTKNGHMLLCMLSFIQVHQCAYHRNWKKTSLGTQFCNFFFTRAPPCGWMPHTNQVPGSGPRFRIQNFIRFCVCN